MKRVSAYTLGCKVNQYDTTAMLELLKNAGFEEVAWGEPSDVCLINTCTVTNTADKKSRNIIRRAAKQSPGAFVCVCGCLAQDRAEELLQIEGVDAAVGTDGRADIVRIVLEGIAGKAAAGVADIAGVAGFEPLCVSSSGELTRGYIKIQEGCNNFCSYCIIPHVRGRARSREAKEVLREAGALAQSGVKEIVLTGINISAYGGLLELTAALNDISGIERIRFGSLEPPLLTEEFVAALSGLSKVCPHFHVSLQSGSDAVLKSMNRKYSTEEYFERVQTLRKYFDTPAITTDIITGFPGETEAAFCETLDFVRRAQFARLHVFPYSEREGTAAAAMQGSVDVAERKERARRLIERGEAMEAAYLDGFLNTPQTVLVEREQGGFLEGYTDRYIRVHARAGSARPGEIRSVLLKRRARDIMFGELEG